MERDLVITETSPEPHINDVEKMHLDLDSYIEGIKSNDTSKNPKLKDKKQESMDKTSSDFLKAAKNTSMLRLEIQKELQNQKEL